MKRIFPPLLLICALLFLVGCQNSAPVQEASYRRVTAKDAKELMDTEKDYVILDVRTQEEFDSGHIPNAILLPDYDIAEQAESVLADKDQLIFVYCRSGNRSKNASGALVKLGYTNVVEFGGINQWPYAIER